MFRLLSKYEPFGLYKHKINYTAEVRCTFVRHKSFYEALGLNSDASLKDIKSAYYKLCLEHHPDRNNGSLESIAKFREITEAYEILSNPEKKQRYDDDADLSFREENPDFYHRPSRGYKPSYYRGPFTGRTKYYNYDEHFKHHYEEDERKRAENEYLRKRWKAEFYRQYPSPEDFYYRRSNFKSDEDYETAMRTVHPKKRKYFLLLTLWSLFVMIQAFNKLYYPKKRHIT